MTFVPLKHQISAQPLMKNMEENGNGGFLSDGCGMGKCLHPETKVLLWNGGYKFAKNIAVGDLLIGDDSQSRKVLSICSGEENMYTIHQIKGEDYTVNEPHILSLKVSQHKYWYWYENKKQYIVSWFDRERKKYRSKCFGTTYGDKELAYTSMMLFRNSIDDNNIVDIPVNEYLTLNKTTQTHLNGFKVGVNFPAQPVFLDPYLLGAWLGDGHSNASNVDEEIMECEKKDSITYQISGTKRHTNPFKQTIDFYDLRNNKHIPESFLHNSRQVRLEVLAGLIDTDGYRTQDKCCYEIVQKNKKLAENIAYLSRSLGFFVSFRVVEKREGTYYKCIISGNGLDEVPVLLQMKKCSERVQTKSDMISGITVEPSGMGKYCGFTIDGNRRFLLHDFTVTHNTVTMSMYLTCNKISRKTDLIVCPFSVLSTWKEWLDKVKDWGVKDGETRRSPRILVYHGAKRKTTLKNNHFDYVITTYAIIGTGELNLKSWGRVVLDESHYIKNGLRGKPPKCARAAFAIGQRSVKNWNLTATPFNNRMKDIAAQCLFIGTAPFNDPTWWKEHGEDEEYVSEWRGLFVIRRTKDGLLAKPLYHNIHVDPANAEEKLVNALRASAAEDFKAWKIARRHGDNYERIKLQGKLLGLILKLRIISNSYYSGEGAVDPEEVLVNNAKVERMVNDLDRAVDNDAKKGVVFFSQFTSFLEVFEQVIEYVMPGVEVLKFYGGMSMEDRDDTVFRFNNARHPRVILVSLMAGGVGLSLHHGSATVMLAEPYYNPFAEQQAEERVHRLGQEEQVNVYRYYMNNSVENWIDGLKQKKLTLAGGLNLVNKEIVPTGFCFDDIADLFKEHVAFLNPDEKDEKKPDGKRKLPKFATKKPKLVTRKPPKMVKKPATKKGKKFV
jgi:hypothetical protein